MTRLNEAEVPTNTEATQLEEKRRVCGQYTPPAIRRQDLTTVVLGQVSGNQESQTTGFVPPPSP